MASTAPSMESHQQAVKSISSSVKDFYDRKEKFRIYHGSTNSTRQFVKRTNVVDTSSLSRVLHVDTQAKTALVEPNVPMDRLVEETMKHGLIPPVVMEFPGITVGGGYAGTSGESSSFKHGFFDRTINSVEMVLANGEIVNCSNTERADLFHGAAGAVGSLGVTTLVELQLRQATRFVETTYHPVASMTEATKKLLQATQDSKLDYVDGIMFSRNEGAIITGRLTDTPAPDTNVQTFSNPGDPWFYLHVQDRIKQYTAAAGGAPPITDAIPTAEYLFRYDRGGFWVGASAFQYFWMPFNKLTRWFLDDFLHTRMMYTALHASGISKKFVVQDLALPYSAAEEFVEYADKNFGIYPLWLCPLHQSPPPTMHPHLTDKSTLSSTPMLNIGLWGFGPPTADEFVRKNQDLEAKLRELGGMKWLYAQTYYSEDDFWSQYDRKWYDRLREKYDATTLPSVYDKVKVDPEAEKSATQGILGGFFANRWPFDGLYGLRAAISSGSYLQARASTWRSKG
ncbi:MAG: hypothetical protein OHK93_005988 [Ramalina farinacea]|uniref:Delta(24)-sterol reductase n=1 Tax=Ramalina farinacea TaxID=258253 RepID=A0AA43QJ63_9LECA|nr:hypothetical protein [Ramalina farinacea]